MNPEVQKIISGNQNETGVALKSFVEKNWEVFTFEDLNVNSCRSDLWKVLFGLLGNKEASALHAACLKAIRILSRDKTDLDKLITRERLEILLRHADLKINDRKNDIANHEVQLEALKSICNIIYNISHSIAIFSEINCLEGILRRTKVQSDSKSSLEIKLFDMKILFLITALNGNIRPQVKLLGGLTCLIDALNFVTNKYDQQTTIHDVLLSNAGLDLTCEILKVLFNLTVHKNDDDDEEEKPHYAQLSVILYNLLLIPTENSTKRLELHNHIVNLLTNMPNEYYNLLIVPIKGNENVSKDLQYKGHDMQAIYQLYSFLKSRFKEEQAIKMQDEQFSPILIVLVKATSSRIIRKYLRSKLLPPLKDVYNRPEQGNTIRNRLCRLLTTPVVNVRDLTADLLFKLCKENVGRMVKYTGYGNAAGLFAQRGLLAGSQSTNNQYSSDSEDSDTEEYRECKNEINPVIGCYEPPHPDSTAGMTEEQKEYEAMQLVNLMDRLTRGGVVQPCRIGEDGKPQPIEHILQLQED